MRNLFAKWPWPAVLPFVKKRDFPLLKPQSIAAETKNVMVMGDAMIVGLLMVGAYRVYFHWTEGNYATLRSHLIGMPPALIAQDFSFDDISSNRTITAEEAKAYRTELKNLKGPVENIIFKY